MGPLEHMDTIGLELTASVQDTVLPEISAARSASTHLAGLIESGRRGYKDGQGSMTGQERIWRKLRKRGTGT